METRMRLRSSVSKEDKELIMKKKKIQEEEKLNRPFIKYKGKIKYCTSFIDCAVVSDELLNLANSWSDEILVVGFDLEWPFSFQTGPGKTAVMQISPNLEICHILHVSELKNLPKGLTEFLEHPKVRITGVNIKNDVRKLGRDFPGFDVEKVIEKTIDTGVFANGILPLTQRWSMEKLVDYVLEMKINKDKKVRMSKWHIVPLSKEQQIYAAIDAYASLLLYFDLKKREEELNKKQELDKEQVLNKGDKLNKEQELNKEQDPNLINII